MLDRDRQLYGIQVAYPLKFLLALCRRNFLEYGILVRQLDATLDVVVRDE